MSKHRRKHTQRQKPTATADPKDGAGGIHDAMADVKAQGGGVVKLKSGEYDLRPPLKSPIVLAHEQLDEWIKGEIGGNRDNAYRDQVDAAGFGVINLGKLQRTMVLAREFYTEHKDILQVEKYRYQSNTAGTRPEPRRTPTDGAAVTMANARSEQVPAIPLPLFGLKKQCSCGQSFWKLHNYEAHYAHKHIVLGEQPL